MDVRNALKRRFSLWLKMFLCTRYRNRLGGTNLEAYKVTALQIRAVLFIKLQLDICNSTTICRLEGSLAGQINDSHCE